MGIRLRTLLTLDASVADVDKDFGKEVKWMQGYRINLDSRLLLLGLRRLLTQKGLKESELKAADFVLGCELGAMESYERFADSLIAGPAAPLAFASALPSMPMACAGVYYGLHGHTYTVVGGADVGLRALRQAVRLAESGAATHVVTGCWRVPSETRDGMKGGEDCRLVLLLIEPSWNGQSAFRAIDVQTPYGVENESVGVLSEFLRQHELVPADELSHA